MNGALCHTPRESDARQLGHICWRWDQQNLEKRKTSPVLRHCR
jgi:hypothetical protein